MKPREPAGRRLALIGESADFQARGDADNPEWEHVVLRRSTDCSIVTLDTLASGRLLRNRYVDIGRIFRLGRRLHDEPVALAQSEQAGYQAALAMATRRSRNRLYIIFHGHRWWTRRNRAFASMVRRMSTVRMLCLSESLRDLLVDELEFDRSRVGVTGFGVDARFFEPGSSSAPSCVVSAGTASRDYRCLLDASRGLDVQVEIAADSTWYREDLNIATTPVPHNVSVFSAGNYRALRDLYARARFVVVPMLDVRHACGYAVIAEAMAMGKAVIATRTGAPSDLITEGVTGLYVPPGDDAALRRAMSILLDDPALARRLGAAARVAVERDFSLTAYVGRLKDAMGLVT